MRKCYAEGLGNDLTGSSCSEELTATAGRTTGCTTCGGGIFETLPVAQREPAIFEEFFATPQEVDFGKLAACHGVEHLQPSSWEEFETLMTELPAQGVRIVELRTDRKRDVSMRADLLAAAGAVS